MAPLFFGGERKRRNSGIKERMRIWTTQTKAFWEQLQSQGSIYCESRYAQEDPFFKERYDWFSEQMRLRIGPPPLPEIQYAIWGWKQVGNYKKERHPNFRDGNPCVDNHVFLTLEIPGDKVLLTDFDLWSYVLNGWYIPADRADIRRFDRINKQLGETWIPFEEKPEEIQAEIRRSWERIFDLDHPNYIQRKHKRNRWIQASFWELKKDWVVDCIPVNGYIRANEEFAERMNLYFPKKG